MAVTIDEMHVDVKEATAPTAAPATEADQSKGINLREAMQLIQQRAERLQAD